MSIEKRTRLAEIMREQFGSRAAEIARDQADHAADQTRHVWLCVVRRIEEAYSPARVSADAAHLSSTAFDPPAQAMAVADAAFKAGDHATRNHWMSVAFMLMSGAETGSGETDKPIGPR